MKDHVKILGVLYIACSSLGILAAIIVFVAIVGGGLISGDMQAIGITMTVGTVIAVFLTIISVPGLIGGIGLLNLKSWSRILVLVLGCLNLLNIPLGTILGIYSIWVLVSDETVKLFAERINV